MSRILFRPHRFLGLTLRVLGRAGVRLSPFLVVEEGQNPIGGIPRAEGLQLSLAETANIEELLRLQKEHTHKSLEDWFAQGRLCFIARDGNRVVALMWADLDAFNYPPNLRKLRHDEAYLFAAIADPDYRGKNVAPVLRQFCYDVLRERGISRFYSYSDYLNVAARKFKAKLDAREIELRLYVNLSGWWSRTFTLKRYG